MGQAVARGTARNVFDFVVNALIGLDLRVLALVGASRDADRDCDVACAGELLVSVPCARLILTTSPCSFNLCASSTSPRGYLICPNAFNIHHPNSSWTQVFNVRFLRPSLQSPEQGSQGIKEKNKR